MKSNIYTQFIGTLLILAFIVPSVFLAFPPKKAEAQWITFSPSEFVQQVINVANTTSSAFSNYSLQYKAFVLDTLATMLAKQLIRQITASVVNWINSGFEGSPSFLTNPGSFFLDVADQFTGAWLSKFGGNLNGLCSPFSIDIRLALAFKYRPNLQKRYACTLGTIIANTKNAAENATINGQRISGFMNGDFSQGGWPAFVSLTTEPQNNVYGAYLSAESDIAMQIASANAQQRDELGQGRGFLSWKKCVQYANDKAPVQGASYTIDSETGAQIPIGQSGGGAVDPERADGSNGGKGKCIKEETQTPGSVIVNSLETSINSPQLELALVDSINEIVGALAAQLVNTVLQGGLKAISGTGASDSSSYLYEIQAESNNSNSAQFNGVRNEFTKNVQTYIATTLDYKNKRDAAVNIILNIKNSYLQVRACYANKISSPNTSSAARSQAQYKIKELDEKVARDVTPAEIQLKNAAEEANGRYNTLIGLKREADSATTVSQVNKVSVEFAQMLQSQNLTTAQDVQRAQSDLESTQTNASNLNMDVQQRKLECDTTF